MNKTELFIYLLKSVIYAGIFFGYYSLFLKNTIYHSYNRYYLLASMALSVVFPCVTITYSPISKEQVAANPALKYLMYGSTAPVQETHIPWDLIAMGVISVLLLSYLAYSVLRIFRLKAIHSKTQMGEFTFIETDLEEAPFSFFSNLFWKKSISIEEENGQKMLHHELVHIRQKHTWDRLFSQFICAIFWMNPFNWIMQKELQNIHEFIADRDAVGTGEVDAFAKMLLQTYYGNHFLNPSHSFYYSSIKRRISMLTTSKTPKYAYLRKVAVLPLFAISLILISFQLSAQKPKSKKEEAAQFTVTMRSDSTTFSDPKTGKKVFTVATRDMPPPPPPAGAPAPPTPPVLTLHGSGSEVKLITIDSTTVEFKGRNSEGKQVVFRAEKVGNTATSPKEKPLIVIDGVITSDLDMNKINPNNIASMNVLKGEKATAKYAEKGANGVIEITTKKP
jgi:TonB-dependent SusC/RagA subfamily outer membrane receptor